MLASAICWTAVFNQIIWTLRFQDCIQPSLPLSSPDFRPCVCLAWRLLLLLSTEQCFNWKRWTVPTTLHYYLVPRSANFTWLHPIFGSWSLWSSSDFNANSFFSLWHSHVDSDFYLKSKLSVIFNFSWISYQTIDLYLLRTRRFTT